MILFFLFLQPQLEDLPDVAIRCILQKLPVESMCTVAETSHRFSQMLQEKTFWSKLQLVTENAFSNKVCCYVLLHCCKVEETLIDNVSTADSEFIVSWIDVLLSAMHNVRKVVVQRAIFLSSGLFLTNMPVLQELVLESCPNICVFSLMQGFQCAKPKMLRTLILTGVPGLNEDAAVRISGSCANLAKFDISGVWGPYLCLPCANNIIEKCSQLVWFDFCARNPKRIGWQQLLTARITVRRLCFGPFITTSVGVDQDTD